MDKLILKSFIILLILQLSLFAREINIDKIVKQATKDNKHAFIFLHKTDCGYCESMIMFTLDDDQIKELIAKKFVYVHINISEDDVVTYKDFKGSGHDFAKHVDYNFYPSSLFFDKNNEIAYAIPGYQEEKLFLNILKYVDSKSYTNMDFEEYEEKFKLKK